MDVVPTLLASAVATVDVEVSADPLDAAGGGSMPRLDRQRTPTTPGAAAVLAGGGAHTVYQAVRAASGVLHSRALLPNAVWRVDLVSSTIHNVSVACAASLGQVCGGRMGRGKDGRLGGRMIVGGKALMCVAAPLTPHVCPRPRCVRVAARPGAASDDPRHAPVGRQRQQPPEAQGGPLRRRRGYAPHGHAGARGGAACGAPRLARPSCARPSPPAAAAARGTLSELSLARTSGAASATKRSSAWTTLTTPCGLRAAQLCLPSQPRRSPPRWRRGAARSSSTLLARWCCASTTRHPGAGSARNR